MRNQEIYAVSIGADKTFLKRYMRKFSRDPLDLNTYLYFNTFIKKKCGRRENIVY